MNFASRLDEYGKAAWIAATILGFWLFWPLGLAVLGVGLWGGAGRRRGFGRWYPAEMQAAGGPRMGWGAAWNTCCRPAAPSPSGNRAFDEYRAETLRRLEEEQKEFLAYLERLRQARDKAEFDQFMAERRGRTVPDQPQG